MKDDLKVKYVGPQMSKQGSQGRKIGVTGNMYPIRQDPNTKIFMYSVNFEPEVKWSKLKDWLIAECKFDHCYHYNLNCIFFTRQHDQEEFTKTVKKRDGEVVNVIFKLKSQLNPNSVEMNSMIGSLARRCISQMDMTPINRGMYIMDSKTKIGNFPYQVVNGYNTAVLPHENELLMTVNLSNKVMSSENANNYMISKMRSGSGNSDAMLSEVVGKTVLTTYNNKTYRVDDVDFNLSPASTFERRQKDGSKIQVSYADYYRENYQVTIRDMKQPLFISRPKTVDRRPNSEEPKMISLIPELCIICGMEEKYKADFQFKKAMDAAIKKDPASRARAVKNFMNEFRRSPANKNFSQWGFQLDDRPVEIPARVLKSITVKFDGSEKEASRPFDFRNVRMFDASQKIARWVLIAPNKRASDDFNKLMTTVSQPLGMNMGLPKEFEYHNPRDIQNILSQVKSFGTKAHMIVLILKNQDKTTYDHFKKETCINMGVPSQCLLAKHFNNQKGVMSIMAKIAVQMQVKVGGTGWSIHFPPAQNYMFVGMDTYHDSSVKGMSCVATVASLDNKFTKYTWATSMVQARQETNTVIRQQFSQLIKQFINVNGDAPTKIIIFRDGVGEGQVGHIMDFEFSQIQQAIKELSPQAETAFLTISKRIEARFYAREQNPPAGTVVDQIATHAGQQDFYMIPLESRQGSVAPIHYRMHFNDLKLKADNFQFIVQMLCYLYSNWTGPIKVPAPCQYAHKLAYLVGTHLHQDPSRDLANQLFFL